MASDVVRSDEFAGLEDGADLCVEGVEGGCGEGFGFGEVRLAAAAGLILFGFYENEDGDVIGVGL